MSLDSLNNAIASIGGTWVKLRTKADPPVDGTILDFEERGKTFEGQPVLSRKSGEQRIEWLFTLQCAGDGADDDGVRKLTANESMQRAIAKAIRDTKTQAAKGGRLQVAVASDPENEREQAEYVARYSPPALPIGDADPFGAPAPTADPFGAPAAPTADPFAASGDPGF